MTERGRFLRPLATRSIAVDVAWAALAAFVFLLPIDLELEHASLAAVLSASVAIALRRISPSAAMAMVVVLGVIQVGGGERPSLVDLALFVVIGTAAVVGTRTEVVVSGVLAVVAGPVRRSTWRRPASGSSCSSTARATRPSWRWPPR